MQIIIINGPNLNLLGSRETDIYGQTGFEDYLPGLKASFPQADIHYFQSNHEGALIDKLHETGFTAAGIVLNAGAYTHTSIAIADAVAAIPAPVIEVHISNIHARESFRHHSYIASKCAGSIVGLGLEGYKLAVLFLVGR